MRTGELVKDESPEEGYELIRSQQFNQIKWTEVNGGIAIRKVKGELSLEPIQGLNNMILHYATYLLDGTEIDSSFRTEQPIGVNLDKKQLIDGFQRGLNSLNKEITVLLKYLHTWLMVEKAPQMSHPILL